MCGTTRQPSADARLDEQRRAWPVLARFLAAPTMMRDCASSHSAPNRSNMPENVRPAPIRLLEYCGGKQMQRDEYRPPRCGVPEKTSLRAAQTRYGDRRAALMTDRSSAAWWPWHPPKPCTRTHAALSGRFDWRHIAFYIHLVAERDAGNPPTGHAPDRPAAPCAPTRARPALAVAANDDPELLELRLVKRANRAGWRCRRKHRSFSSSLIASVSFTRSA